MYIKPRVEHVIAVTKDKSFYFIFIFIFTNSLLVCVKYKSSTAISGISLCEDKYYPLVGWGEGGP